ncbi:MAG: DNA polymerase III subunit gamma/tau [Rikenellaceae bacterium]|nr:DNA polymerase III subunit gamma/tau [Rikenellaceae bacterium]
MSEFIVSARKYRPATFVSVVGQSHVTNTLKNAIARGQLAHAYLFCGPRGVGKTTCARIFAKAINCLSPVDNEACGECESCRSFDQGRSFNIHELDAASNNSVEDIRQLIEQVRIPPQIGRYSVYIIDEVHMLSQAAFNAFLKTLEEPPAHAVFILATTEKHKIIPTILSRCQIFDFNRIRVEDGVEYLRYIADSEGVSYDDQSLNLIARKADGGMRDALSMFDKAVSFCGSELRFKQVAATLNVLDYDTYFDVTSAILAGDYPRALLLFDEVLRNGFSGQIFMAGLNGHFRDLLVCKNPQTAPLLEATGSLLDKYKAQAALCSVPMLFEAIALLTALDGSLKTATNQRLNVELGLMKLCGLGQKKNDDGELTPALPPLGKAGAAGGTTAAAPTSAPAGAPSASGGSGAPAGISSRPAEGAAAGAVPRPVPSAPAPQPASNHSAAPQPAAAQSSMSQSSAPQSSAPRPAAPQSAPAAPAPGVRVPDRSSAAPAASQARPAVSGTPLHSISGNSIASILNMKKGDAAAADVRPDEASDESSAGHADPRSEEKIAAARERFIEALHRERPRIAMAFNAMEVHGDKVCVAVPSADLREEILRNRAEILSLLCDTARIEGALQLEVELREQMRAAKPIKVEDRLKYLTDKNANLTLLRKAMELDIE